MENLCQLMNVFFGGKLERVSGHIASRHKIRMYFDEEKQFIERDVNSFHNWGISINGLATQLTPSAYDSKDFIEAARNEKLNWLGIMWHPEREERFEASDLEILTKLFNEGFS